MSEVVDYKDALERVQDDKELLAELFDIFLEDFPPKRDIINAAFANNDVVTFQQIAHGVKGATGNLSAAQMHETCVALDALGKDGFLDGAKELLEVLDQQFEAFKIEAAKFQQEQAG